MKRLGRGATVARVGAPSVWLAGLLASILSVLAPAGATEPAADADFLFLGSYHMANPGRDVHNTRADDVLAPRRQREIAEVAALLARFQPTKVVVEAPPAAQARLDRNFAASCHGARALVGDEVEQLGFRIACAQGLPGVVAVDWNELGPIRDEDSLDYRQAVERHGQQAQYAQAQRIGADVAAADQATLDHGSVRDMLLRLNSPEWGAANARAYHRIGLYGSADDAVGANWMMLWYGRNLRIFNAVARATAPGDRVLVVYGAGHGNLLRQLAQDSGRYRVHDAVDWLQPRVAAEPSSR